MPGLWRVGAQVRRSISSLSPPERAREGGRQIQVFLRDEGLDNEQVLEWVQEEGVEFIDDLAHAFRSAAHIADEAPFMLEAWLAVAQRKTEAWRRGTDVAQARCALAEASNAIRQVFQPGDGQRGPTRKPRSKRTG